MKARSTRSLRRLLLKITFFSHYTDQIYEMEKALARKPEKFQIDIIGSGELSPDTALLMRSVLLQRSPQTHLITNARSSLQGGSVLVWLLGDTRLIREDAKLYFRRPTDQDEDEDAEAWKDEESKTSDQDLEEVDCVQVLQHINEFLPVKELAGHAIDLQVLKQFGLVDNEKVDRFLAVAFGKADGPVEALPQESEKAAAQQAPKVPRSDQRDRSS
jgi:hypothetical protein